MSESDLQVRNDLGGTIEILLDDSLHVVYPNRTLEKSVEIGAILSVTARLRDDPKIYGTCSVDLPGAGLLSASEIFGSFGDRAKAWLRQDQEEVRRETRLREKRLAVAEQARVRAIGELECGRRCLFGIFLAWIVLALAAGMALGIYASVDSLMSLGSDETPLYSQHPYILVFATPVFSCFLMSIGYAASRFVTLSLSVEAGMLMFTLAMICVTTILCGMWLQFGVGARWLELSICTMLFAPVAILGFGNLYHMCRQKEGFEAEVTADYLYQITEAEQRAKAETIQFVGHVLPGRGRPCVCSWPGKYVSAWDELVKRSRDGHTSAAVVFLPEQTPSYGLHDPIPKSHEKLQGECWCTPLYGKEQPWGCRWRSQWIANIEAAVKEEADLQVYFFRHHRGRGKVKSFDSAGEEYQRRDDLQARRKDFEEAEGFKASLAAGLAGLPKEVRADGSSVYSREVDRLFLAWLPAKDAEFLRASEGLGNSQKAEAAWLERMGYPYTEVEVEASEWLAVEDTSNPPTPSPKAEGRRVAPEPDAVRDP